MTMTIMGKWKGKDNNHGTLTNIELDMTKALKSRGGEERKDLEIYMTQGRVRRISQGKRGDEEQRQRRNEIKKIKAKDDRKKTTDDEKWKAKDGGEQ